MMKVCEHVRSTLLSELIAEKPEEALELSEWADTASGDDVEDELRKRLAAANMMFTPTRLRDSIDLALANPAIVAEISRAKETYKASRQFAAASEGSRIIQASA